MTNSFQFKFNFNSKCNEHQHQILSTAKEYDESQMLEPLKPEAESRRQNPIWNPIKMFNVHSHLKDIVK